MDPQARQGPEVDAAAAHARQRAGALLVDVRAAHERAPGMAAGALGAARDALEAEPGAFLPPAGAGTEILLICQGGRRTMLAAQALQARG
jgi:rhodanese-related sulfurtransferase